MKLLVFDTETTGLPKSRNKIGEWWIDYPNIIQLSWVLYDSELDKMISYGDDIIKLKDGKKIPEDSIKIHKITNDEMNEKGIPILEALVNFNIAIECCDIIIAHNLEFDKNMIISEMLRNDIIPVFNIYNKEEYCTMKTNIEFCKIKRFSKYGKEYYKYPKLEELHSLLFKEENKPKNLHNALNDVIICLRCYLYQQENIDIYKERSCSKIKEMLQNII